MATVTKTPPSNKNGPSPIVRTMIDDAARRQSGLILFAETSAVPEGSAGNIGVLKGKDSKLLVDSSFTVSKSRLLDALNRLSSDPVARLLNTHWHTDHSNGNAWLHHAEARITAHINTKKYLSTSTQNGRFSFAISSSVED